MTNALAYFRNELITAVKSFLLHAPWRQNHEAFFVTNAAENWLERLPRSSLVFTSKTKILGS